MEKFVTMVKGVAVGTDKTLINIFHSLVTPVSRGKITSIILGSATTPADQATHFRGGRTTAVGVEGSGFVPNNLDPVGPAGDCDSGLGAFGTEPTYTANKQLIEAPLNQRSTFQWLSNFMFELIMAATQNNGFGLKSTSSTGTPASDATIYFED